VETIQGACRVLSIDISRCIIGQLQQWDYIAILMGPKSLLVHPAVILMELAAYLRED
jgi:hypothetical protein